MIFYSLSGSTHSTYFKVKKITKTNRKDHINFYFNLFDELFQNILLENCLDSKSIKVLKKNKNSKLVIDYSAEVITIEDIEKITRFMKQHCVPLNKIKIIVQDSLQKDFFLKNIEDTEISNSVKILATHYFIAGTQTLNFENNFITKKFSLLVRRHDQWRLKLLLMLEKKRLLDEFRYSYLAIDNNTGTSKDFKDLKKNLELTTADEMFCKKIPIKLSLNDTGEYNSELISNALYSTDINVVAETVYDQTDYVYTKEKQYNRDYAPTDLSEKTLKSIALGKPFIVIAAPFFLDSLKTLGYKTFDPYINENYDLEINNEIRLNLIAEEIERITKLSGAQYSSIVCECNKIAEYNKSLFLKYLKEYELLKGSLAQW